MDKIDVSVFWRLPEDVLKYMLHEEEAGCNECSARSGLNKADGLCNRCNTREYIFMLRFILQQKEVGSI